MAHPLRCTFILGLEKTHQTSFYFSREADGKDSMGLPSSVFRENVIINPSHPFRRSPGVRHYRTAWAARKRPLEPAILPQTGTLRATYFKVIVP